MPRSSGRRAGPARPAPARPTAPPARSGPPATQQRSSSTAAGARPQAGPQQQAGGSGLFGQMAATAGGVAVGSSIGHAIGGLFGGGSSAQATEQQDPALASQQQSYGANASGYAYGCDNAAKDFTRCLDENKGEHSMSICSWYLDQLAAAKQY